ncbi:GrpB family protein [Brevibacterium ammoniilyticum]|uniref:GrpB family protein n=1 Tax=Brevibacterium ammoniilyticum TaxID=1046555 RepID=A0ABP9TXF7_9MICO
MPVEVVPYSEAWPTQFANVAGDLSRTLETLPVVSIEHVGSTSVPDLAAKPILDIDIIVKRQHVAAALSALATKGYVHRGDLGVTDREALEAPDEHPPRNVYVCVDGTLHLRNHLAVRDILRRRADFRERYGAVKVELARDPEIDITTYIAKKSDVLQDVLAASDLSDEEKALILKLNTSTRASATPE